MALTNNVRIGWMLDWLAAGLKPVVEQAFTKAYGSAWVSTVEAAKGTGEGASDPSDPQFLLNAIWSHWQDTLGKALGAAERDYVAELRLISNRLAYPGEKPFTDDDVHRACDTGERLLRSVASPQADTIAKAKASILKENAVAQAKEKQKATAAAPVAAEPLKGLAPWLSLATPRPDVAAGRQGQAEFVADLAQVAGGKGAKEYLDPGEFFARTYLTEGLRLLLASALRRLTRIGGASVVDLQTTYGGGKTHSLLALWHLVDPATPVTNLPGLESVITDAKVSALPMVTRAALVGTALSPITPRVVERTEIRTLWGELAWRLGGAAAFATVAEADRTGVPPGADALRSLLAPHAPVVVLIDEWVTYARLQWGVDDLPGGTFEAALSFARQLAGAIDQVPGALLVVSLPSSPIEVGGEGGQKALTSLKHIVHRLDGPWRPAAPEELSEIVRRRLFEAATTEAMKGRDEVIERFGELYAQHGDSFPAETKENAYLDRLRNCYPIHPELFDRLFDDWSTVERFQRIRGVLSLMAAVVHALWERQDGNLLILPAAVPLDDAAVLPQLTHYLDDSWQKIIETDVDGTSALPLRLDRENADTYGRYSATRRVARTVFLGSAPLPAAANGGIDDRRILLGSVQPGETPATFGDALRRLAGQAAYMHENDGRYWYATQPSINQLARDRARLQAEDRVESEVERRLKSALADRGPFARVYASPKSASDVPDEDEVALVVLGPRYAYDAKAATSTALAAAGEILASRGVGARPNQNMLVFLAADSLGLAELTRAVGEFLAWSSIVDDVKAGRLNLDAFQRKQATLQRDGADQAARACIPETYRWLLVPERADPLAKITLRPVMVSGSDALAVRAGARLGSEGHLITKFGGADLRLILDGVLKEEWSTDHAVLLRQLWSWFAQHPYLPRLLDISVLEGAVRDGSSSRLWRSETFAYAAAREAAGQYRGIVAGWLAETPATFTSLIVDPSVLPDPLPSGDAGPWLPPPPPPGPPPHVVRRFHGEVAFGDPRRPMPELAKIVDEVIDHLARQTDVRLRVTMEIEAELAAVDGFAEDAVRTISENAKTLRFTDFGWDRGPQSSVRRKPPGRGHPATFVDGRLTTSYKIGLLYDPTKPVTSGSIPIRLYLCNESGANLSSRSINVTALEVTRGSSTVVAISPPNNLFSFSSTLQTGGGYQYNLSSKGLATGQKIAYTLKFRVSTDPAGIYQHAPFILR